MINGVATFSNLAIDTAGTYELAATSTGLTTGISTSITITAGDAEQLIWVAQPASTETEGFPFGAASSWKIGTGTLRPITSVSLSLDFNGSPDKQRRPGGDGYGDHGIEWHCDLLQHHHQ